MFPFDDLYHPSSSGFTWMEMLYAYLISAAFNLIYCTVSSTNHKRWRLDGLDLFFAFFPLNYLFSVVFALMAMLQAYAWIAGKGKKEV